MAKRFKEGDAVYFPVKIDEVEYGDRWYDYVVRCNGVKGGKGEFPFCVKDEELKTADEIAIMPHTERDEALEELKSRNAELEALLKEVMATRDEAIRQNDELRKENDNLKSDCNDWKDTADDRIVDVQNLTAERDNLKADLATQKEVNEELKKKIAELTEWYMEANRTATEAAEANDDLKAKIAELRDEVATLKAERCSLNGQVGKNLAEIQALSSDVHFFKEACKKQKAECDELKGRYDELDSVNHEQAEKIRRQDKALTDLKKRNDDLQAENTNLTFLLEDAPEKETTKTLHVVLNDGTEIEFRRYTAYDYRTDINMFVVKDGERFIAGFLRGDKPMNLAYWWTE